MELNPGAIFGFGIASVCWMYLIFRRGRPAVWLGIKVILVVSLFRGGYLLFQHLWGREGMFAFLFLAATCVGLIWIRQRRK
jgi:hypothetical protein